MQSEVFFKSSSTIFDMNHIETVVDKGIASSDVLACCREILAFPWCCSAVFDSVVFKGGEIGIFVFAIYANAEATVDETVLHAEMAVS